MINQNALESLAQRARHALEANLLQTEEASKHTLVLPFLQSLGYDPFDPETVVPEYTADFGIKAGEKVDYAIIQDGDLSNPILLIECKKVGDSLDRARASQLARYFTQTPAKIGILTNGIEYHCYSDLDAENVMDEIPFVSLSILELDPQDVRILNYLSKGAFDVEEARTAASNLRYTNGMKAEFASLYTSPDEEFVRLMAGRVFGGRLTANRMEHFTNLTKLAFQGFVNDRLNSTLQRASDIANEPPTVDDDTAEAGPETEPESADSRDVVTTAEEIAAYETVQTLLADMVEPERIVMRDTKSYCNILLDDNNRKIIVRLYFNSKAAKHLGWVYGSDIERDAISDVNELAQYADKMRERVAKFEAGATNITLRET